MRRETEEEGRTPVSTDNEQLADCLLSELFSLMIYLVKHLIIRNLITMSAIEDAGTAVPMTPGLAKIS